MKIGNSVIYFSNTNRLKPEDCNYYAVYDYNAEGVVYMGTFTKNAIVEDITRNYKKYGRHIHAYARKTMNTRGKTGRYEVKITTTYSSIPNTTTIKRIKNKYAAKRSVYWDITYGHSVRIIDTETGKVIGHWNDEKED